MKKLKTVPVALMLSLAFALTAGCTTNPPEGEGGCNHNYVGGWCTNCGEADPNAGSGGEIGGEEGFTYYNKTNLRADKKIYAVNMDGELNTSDLNTVSALQGLYARKEVTFYIDGKYMSNGINADQYYLEEAKENYGVTVENISLETAVKKYVADWNSMVTAKVWGSEISLADGFKYSPSRPNSAYTETSGAGYSTAGYIVYDPGTVSVNIASTLAGITGFLPVAKADVEKYKSYGLVEKMDVTNSIMYGYQWCWDRCLPELSNEGLIHQNYSLNGQTNYYMRDYGVMNKYFHVYYDTTFDTLTKLKTDVHKFVKKNVPIFGYTFSEDRDVALFSQYGQFIVPTDYTMNLTFHLAGAFRKDDGFTQPNSDKAKPAEQGKHYVSFVVSDGDNAQYWQNTSIFSSSYMNAPGRDSDDFPVTWSITPSLSDMMPLVMDAAYNSDITTANDYFCAPVSGQGYINAGKFYNAGTEYMTTFLNNLDTYLDRAGLGVTTIIGAEGYSGTGGIYGTLDAYAKVPALKGGLVLNGNKYFGGSYSGGVYWSNGKPFIVPRDSLWTTTPAYVAARINRYASTTTGKDITNIDAYTVINVHPWSHNYKDIRTIANMLSENVEIVSVDRLVAMMTDNVATKNTAEFARPASGDGTTITDADLQKDPTSIPVNPLFNDFLLYEEDWTGANISHSSSDTAAGEQYGSFKTNLEIRGVASKKAFTLPNDDDLWVTFYARANSVNPEEKATFNLKMTVDGTEKTIIANAEMKGVAGTATKNVKGDGWQTFTFPVKQYFADYKGKEATVTIEAAGSVSIKIDQFTVTARPFTKGPTNGDYYTNDFADGSTEDWLLGDVFETSQYHSWAAVDRKTGKPNGKLEVDASDGGGNEKRNANVNVWFAKNIDLKGNDKLTINVGGDADGRENSALSKLSMYVDGKLIVIYDWQQSYCIGEEVYNLAELCSAAGVSSLEGKNATFVFEVRDSADYDGAGQDFYLDYFNLTV